MSTRCNVIIRDKYGELIFYRHSDGYPQGVAKTLGEFIDLVRNNKIRNNVGQASGWLILLGYEEYQEYNDLERMRKNTQGTGIHGWKVGAYEPSTCIHGDIEYLYEIDLDKKTLRGWKHDGDNKGEEITASLEQYLTDENDQER